MPIADECRAVARPSCQEPTEGLAGDQQTCRGDDRRRDEQRVVLDLRGPLALRAVSAAEFRTSPGSTSVRVVGRSALSASTPGATNRSVTDPKRDPVSASRVDERRRERSRGPRRRTRRERGRWSSRSTPVTVTSPAGSVSHSPPSKHVMASAALIRCISHGVADLDAAACSPTRTWRSRRGPAGYRPSTRRGSAELAPELVGDRDRHATEPGGTPTGVAATIRLSYLPVTRGSASRSPVSAASSGSREKITTLDGDDSAT